MSGQPFSNPGFQPNGSNSGHSPATLHAQMLPGHGQPHGHPGINYQRLKVEDALSYLDKVKLQFGNQPHIYNEFLDIMKEFKSQAIDTPGVIQRVSSLFKGHPDLIVGFNTFLPPGYKIEVQSNDTINVHQPGLAVMSLSTIDPMAPMRPQYLPPDPAPSHNFRPQEPLENKAPVFGGPPPTSGSGQPGQPVEFNHAISYVNKIKNRFQTKPEVYKQFLEILHTYQKEQRTVKEGPVAVSGHKPLTEAEVYAQVQSLFNDQSDLLNEFGQFLPDAAGHPGYLGGLSQALAPDTQSLTSVDKVVSGVGAVKRVFQDSKPSPAKAGVSASVKRNAPKHTAAPPAKKVKTGVGSTGVKDVSLAEAGKYGTLSEYAFFDKVRKALKNQEVYDNFLRCLVLFNQNLVTRDDLVGMVQPFLGRRHPELNRWFKDFLGCKEQTSTDTVPQGATTGGKDRMSEMAMHVDFATCKQYGVSYRALPNSYVHPKCTGRATLPKEIKETLNDTWVSFPSWSEDSSHVNARKTTYEEILYRCEDERFELDIVIDLNHQTINHFQAILAKMERMSYEEASRFQLDDSLGGGSEVLYRKAVARLYGDKAPEIVDGLKKNPCVAVPLVLRRLRSKEAEWREHQKRFQKIWREQCDKYHLRSLDYQGANFKQPDSKAMRSKSLVGEIETIFDEQKKRAGEVEGFLDNINQLAVTQRPVHLDFRFPDRCVMEDATGLIIHHVKRQSGLHKDDKSRIKALLLHDLPDMLFLPRGLLSDDEDDTASDDVPLKKLRSETELNKEEVKEKIQQQQHIQQHEVEQTTVKTEPKDAVGNEYCLMISNGNWYVFFRLYHLLCDRLAVIYKEYHKVMKEEANWKKERTESCAIALRLRMPTVEPDQYYPYFLDRVRDLLDGNIEAGQFEDIARELFGIHGYIAFTMDRLVQNLVRQLQHMIGDEVCHDMLKLFHSEKRKGSCGGAVTTATLRVSQEMAYQRKAEQLIGDDNLYRLTTFKHGLHLSVEMLDTDAGGDSSEESCTPQEMERWMEYIADFCYDDEALRLGLLRRFSYRPVFLTRNIAHVKARRHQKFKSKMKQHRDQRYLDDDEIDAFNRPDDDDESFDSEKADDEFQDALQEMRVVESSECKFNVNSFHLMFSVGGGSLQYRPAVLEKARQTHKAWSGPRSVKFAKWLNTRVNQVVSADQKKQGEDWFLGNIEGLKPGCGTSPVLVNIPERRPYHIYRRFRLTSRLVQPQ